MAAATAFLAGATIFGAGAQILGAKNQAAALKAQGIYQQQIAESNARSLETMAGDSLERGKQASSLVRQKAKSLKGSQRAGYAGQGVDVNSGTALAVQDETFTMGELDALTVKNNAWREAWGYKVEAQQTRAGGRFGSIANRNAASNTLLTGGLGGLSTIFEGSYRAVKG